MTVYFADEEHRYRAGGAFRAWDGQEGYAGRSDWMASLTQRCVEEWRCEHAADNQQGHSAGETALTLVAEPGEAPHLEAEAALTQLGVEGH